MKEEFLENIIVDEYNRLKKELSNYKFRSTIQEILIKENSGKRVDS